VGQLVSIVHTPEGIDPEPPDHYARIPLMAATLEPGLGIVGDRKGSSRERQLNVMAAETLSQLCDEGFHTAAGEMGEQLVISNIPIDHLVKRTRLRIGAEAVIEVVKPRTGCARFEHIQHCTRSDVAGRLGVMARVMIGGNISVGDSVTVEGTTAS
jgi:MOSC domain-containing protein YiiM